MAFPREGHPILKTRHQFQILDILTDNIENNEFYNFQTMFVHLSKDFYRKLNRHGFTLLQECMRKNRKELFDFLYIHHDKDDLGTLAALEYLLNCRNHVDEYYAGVLLNTYSSVTDDENLLVRSSEGNYIQVSKFLLDEGVDVNAQNRYGHTPLHKALMNPSSNSEELITTLLCYGADPSIEDPSGYNAFELAVKHEQTDFAQEVLFNYTFDNLSHYKIYFDVLLQLAQLKSPLFYQLLECNVKFLLNEFIRKPLPEVSTECLQITPSENSTLTDLLFVDIDYLKLILEKFDFICSDIFETHFLYNSMNKTDIERMFYTENILLKLDLVLQRKEIVNICVCNFINSLDSYKLFCCLCKRINKTQVTEIFVYLLSYGLRAENKLFQAVFDEYGYCELFKLLLHTDVEAETNNALVSYICDVNLTLDALLSRENFYTADSFFKLMNYFEDPKLRDLITKKVTGEKSTREKNHPHVPLLVEMARNVFRKHFVKKLCIKNKKQFYSLLNGLPVNVIHKKIITLETKLYDI